MGSEMCIRDRDWLFTGSSFMGLLDFQCDHRFNRKTDIDNQVGGLYLARSFLRFCTMFKSYINCGYPLYDILRYHTANLCMDFDQRSFDNDGIFACRFLFLGA